MSCGPIYRALFRWGKLIFFVLWLCRSSNIVAELVAVGKSLNIYAYWLVVF